MIPDEKQALELHRKYGSSERIVKHCQTVNGVAVTLADLAGRALGTAAYAPGAR